VRVSKSQQQPANHAKNVAGLVPDPDATLPGDMSPPRKPSTIPCGFVRICQEWDNQGRHDDGAAGAVNAGSRPWAGMTGRASDHEVRFARCVILWGQMTTGSAEDVERSTTMSDNIIDFDSRRRNRRSPEELQAWIGRMDELEEILETMDELGVTTRGEIVDLLEQLEKESGDEE
jgi:hypothetical protein